MTIYTLVISWIIFVVMGCETHNHKKSIENLFAKYEQINARLPLDLHTDIAFLEWCKSDQICSEAIALEYAIFGHSPLIGD